ILLGGEVSGHMFFGEGYYAVDDGILAACKIVEIVARDAGPASRLFDSIEHLHATPELKAPCPDDKKFQLIDELSRDLKQRYETSRRLFAVIWRVNAVLILLTAVLACAVLSFGAWQIYREATRTRRVSAVVNIAEDRIDRSRLQLGSFQKIEGSGVLRAPLQI